ncbi:hypothetical protein IE077_003074 [Cardiosporidium cionae]|uniref:Uncharacterized protein n=1 Tax=Cardiosporidium cionae TaxID=476202 RepID=A0ABQ7JGB8_9APIC|nr:hypothetical protein IE077_003074 [Cardiosporidium cionae]|eukprot:KAF8822700.1 hypothetical protein IE077_003074 [Cardiosporidium cionae]
MEGRTVQQNTLFNCNLSNLHWKFWLLSFLNFAVYFPISTWCDKIYADSKQRIPYKNLNCWLREDPFPDAGVSLTVSYNEMTTQKPRQQQIITCNKRAAQSSLSNKSRDEAICQVLRCTNAGFEKEFFNFKMSGTSYPLLQLLLHRFLNFDIQTYYATINVTKLLFMNLLASWRNGKVNCSLVARKIEEKVRAHRPVKLLSKQLVSHNGLKILDLWNSMADTKKNVGSTYESHFLSRQLEEKLGQQEKNEYWFQKEMRKTFAAETKCCYKITVYHEIPLKRKLTGRNNNPYGPTFNRNAFAAARYVKPSKAVERTFIRNGFFPGSKSYILKKFYASPQLLDNTMQAQKISNWPTRGFGNAGLNHEVTFNDWDVKWKDKVNEIYHEYQVGNRLGFVGITADQLASLRYNIGFSNTMISVLSHDKRNAKEVDVIQGNYGIKVGRSRDASLSTVGVLADSVSTHTAVDHMDRDYMQSVRIKQFEVGLRHDFDDLVKRMNGTDTEFFFMHNNLEVNIEANSFDTRYSVGFEMQENKFLVQHDFDETKSHIEGKWGPGWEIVVENDYEDRYSNATKQKVAIGLDRKIFASAGIGTDTSGNPTGSFALKFPDVGYTTEMIDNNGNNQLKSSIILGKFSYKWSGEIPNFKENNIAIFQMQTAISFKNITENDTFGQ